MKCDNCKKLAVYNLQSGLMLWKINKKGIYSDDPEIISADGETNGHYCKKHYEEIS